MSPSIRRAVPILAAAVLASGLTLAADRGTDWALSPPPTRPTTADAGVWSFMLAARERRLGTAWPSLHLMFEEQAAEVLGIPFSEVTQVALIPVAYTRGTDFRPAKRGPAEAHVHWDSWAGVGAR